MTGTPTRSRAFTVALVNVPQADPSQIGLAVPRLAAFLRASGRARVLTRDLNIEAYTEHLTLSRVCDAGEWVRSRLAALTTLPGLEADDASLYRRLVETGARLARAIGVADALEVLRSDAFFDVDRYLDAIATLDAALDVVSAPYHPARWSTFHLELPFDTESLDALAAGARDVRCNPFIGLLKQQVLPWLEQERVDLLGISMTYATQLVPGLALARLAREHLAGLEVVLGGAAICHVARALEHSPRRLDLAEYIVYSEGETALESLCSELASGRRALSRVPNLLYRDPASGSMVRTPLHIEDLRSHPTPCFDGLPVASCLSPRPVLMLDVSRGCYWGRCAFCSYGLSSEARLRYRERPVEAIVRDMESLGRRWGTEAFSFAVDVLSPSLLDRLGRRLRERGLKMHWMGDIRMEPAFTPSRCVALHEAGCRLLSMGLESACPRVMDHMQKGTRRQDLEPVLQALDEAGIAVNLQFFFGFPTETRDEAAETLDFVVAHADLVSTVGFGHFHLSRGSDVEQEPERYGVRRIDRPPASSCRRCLDFETESGMSQEESRGFFKQAYRTLERLYPLTRNSSLLIGAHALLLASHHGAQRFRSMTRGGLLVRSTGLADRGVVRLAPETALLELPFDLGAPAGARDDADRCSDPLAREPDMLRFLVKGDTGQRCKLSARLAALVERIGDGISIETLLASQQELRPSQARYLLGRLLRAGVLEQVEQAVARHPGPEAEASPGPAGPRSDGG